MSTPKPIYLDNAASTPCDPRVVEAMMPYFTQAFGNPACGHEHGLEARRAVDHAREQAAALIHASPDEIIWTASATEANNLAIKDLASRNSIFAVNAESIARDQALHGR